MFNMQKGPPQMWRSNGIGIVRPQMWINGDEAPPQPNMWINSEAQPQMWTPQDAQPQMWTPQNAQPQIWTPQEGQSQLLASQEAQLPMWTNNEGQTQMWVNHGLRSPPPPPVFTSNDVRRLQMPATKEVRPRLRKSLFANNEVRSQLTGNNEVRPRIPLFVNNEVESTPWVNHEEENPEMWVNNGVEQPIRNVIVGPPTNCIKYLTCTEINVDAPQESIGSSVSDYLIFLFESGNYHDTLFSLTDLEMTIPAHSFLLVGRSLLFRKIFVESQIHPCIIPVDGTSYENFKLFLKCFYSDSVDISASTSLDILRLAIKFEVKSLIARCSSSVRANISVNSVLPIFAIASDWDQPDLKHWCLEFISQNASQVLKDSNFEKLTADKILSIVNHDNLDVPEIEIFQAVLRWADTDLRRRKMSASNQIRRKLIGPIMPFIRFLLMSAQELWDIVRPVEALNPAEFMEVYTYVNEKQKGTKNLTEPVGYETTPRGSTYVTIMYDEPCTREANSYLSSTTDKHAFVEEFRFQSDLEMYLCGICLYGPGLGEHVRKHGLWVKYDITFRIMGENRQQNYFSTYEFQKSSITDFEVLLPSNYPIIKDCMYTAIVEVSGYRGRFGMRRVKLKEIKLSGGRFAVVKFFERKDPSVFSHVGICRGLMFTLNSS